MKLSSIISMACFFAIEGIAISAMDAKGGYRCLGATSKCYKVVATEKTQQGAQEACHADGASLASIHSETENKFILDLINEVDPAKKYIFWIGLALQLHQKQDGKIIGAGWLDGSPLDYGNPAKIDPGTRPWFHNPAYEAEPNNFHSNAPELCVNIYHDKYEGWNDENCARTHTAHYSIGYVCQKN